MLVHNLKSLSIESILKIKSINIKVFESLIQEIISIETNIIINKKEFFHIILDYLNLKPIINNTNYLDNFMNLISKKIELILIKYNFVGSENTSIYNDVDYLNKLIHIYFDYKKLNENKIKENCLIILINMLSNYYKFKKIIKFINYWKISKKEIREIINKKIEIFSSICYSGDLELFEWYIEFIEDYTLFINKNNYKYLFSNACKSLNSDITKIIYNLIQSQGIEITKNDLSGVLDSLIYDRWNNNQEKDEIIYNLINFDIKPPKNYPKYLEYYNKINFINNSNNTK